MKTQGFGRSRTYRRKKKRLLHWCLSRFVPWNLVFTRIYIYTCFFHCRLRPSDIVAYCPHITCTVLWDSLIGTSSNWPFHTYCLFLVDLLPTVYLRVRIRSTYTFKSPEVSHNEYLTFPLDLACGRPSIGSYEAAYWYHLLSNREQWWIIHCLSSRPTFNLW